MGITIVWWAIGIAIAHYLQLRFVGLTLFRSKAQVRITYKSGFVMTHWYSEFSYTLKGGTLTGAEWKLLADQGKHLYIGIDEIESIMQTDTRVNIWTAIKNLF